MVTQISLTLREEVWVHMTTFFSWRCLKLQATN